MSVLPKDEEELMLEKLVFGDQDDFEANLKQTENFFEFQVSDLSEPSDDSDEDDQSDGFFIDEGEENAGGIDENAMDIDSSENSDDSSSDSDAENAWDDSEDERMQMSLTSSSRLKKLRHHDTDDLINGKTYIRRLRSQYRKIYPHPQWAEDLEVSGSGDDVDGANDTSDGEDSPRGSQHILDVLNTTDKFTMTKTKLIPVNKLSISRLADANQNRRAKSGIQSVHFHPYNPLLLTGGFDKTLRIYHIDGKLNRLVTSLHVKNCPIYNAQFANNLIFIGGRRKYLNKWDLTTDTIEKISRMYGFEKFQKSMEYFKVSLRGTYIALLGSGGYCNVLDGKTGVFVTNYKIEGVIADFDFNESETELVVVNRHGEVWEFGLGDSQSDKRPLLRWNDESGVGITKLRIGGKWLAIGTNTGVVNLYDRLRASTSFKPFKVIDNLVTTILTLTFSSDGQLLVIASRGKRDALRVVQLPTGTVYSNWPTSGTPLGKVLSVAFTPNNQMMAVGNDQGRVTLWRLNHY